MIRQKKAPLDIEIKRSLFFRADGGRSPSKAHRRIKLPAGIYALVTTCDETVIPSGTKVNPLLDPYWSYCFLDLDPSVFAVVSVTWIVHSFNRVKQLLAGFMLNVSQLKDFAGAIRISRTTDELVRVSWCPQDQVVMAWSWVNCTLNLNHGANTKG